MMNWDEVLQSSEHLCWQATPAPRCFVFRNWKHSLVGVLLTLLATWWQAVGLQMAAVYNVPWLGWLPVPFLLLGLFLAFGHLFLARLEWPRVAYALTDKRLLVVRGLFRSRVEELPLSGLAYFRLRPHGKELGTLRVYSEDGNFLRLNCIEIPRELTNRLEQILADLDRLAAPAPDED